MVRSKFCTQILIRIFIFDNPSDDDYFKLFENVDFVFLDYSLSHKNEKLFGLFTFC